MFGMGGTEILVILIVALLFLGPDKLPEAAKKISKGIRDIKQQSRALQRTIEDDEHIGGAIRDLKSALRGDDEPLRPRPVKPAKQLESAAGTAVVAAIEPAAPPDGAPVAPSADAPAADAPAVAEPTTGITAATVAVPTSAAAAPTGDEPRPGPPARLTLPATAGEADDSAPAASATDDADLAALVKPAANTIARAVPAVGTPSDESTHG